MWAALLLCGRIHLLHLLLSLSCPCPPFSSPLLHREDCQAVLSLLDKDFFPFLALSQLAVARANSLSLLASSQGGQGGGGSLHCGGPPSRPLSSTLSRTIQR